MWCSKLKIELLRLMSCFVNAFSAGQENRQVPTSTLEETASSRNEMGKGIKPQKVVLIVEDCMRAQAVAL